MIRIIIMISYPRHLLYLFLINTIGLQFYECLFGLLYDRYHHGKLVVCVLASYILIVIHKKKNNSRMRWIIMISYLHHRHHHLLFVFLLYNQPAALRVSFRLVVRPLSSWLAGCLRTGIIFYSLSFTKKIT